MNTYITVPVGQLFVMKHTIMFISLNIEMLTNMEILKSKKKSEGRVNILKNHSFYKEHFSIQNK